MEKAITNCQYRTLGSILAIFFVFGVQAVWAQAPAANAIESFSYQLQSRAGNDGASVAYIPSPNVYISLVKGRGIDALEVFNLEGKAIARVESKTNLVSIWYNPETNKLEGNGARDKGWYTLYLDEKGIPAGEWELIRSGQMQPDSMSSMSYVAPKKKLVTVYNGFFSYWGRKNAKEKVRFQHGTPGDTEWFFDPNIACFTGNNKFPIAVFELNGSQILYFDLKGKYLGATIFTAPLPDVDGFPFSFADKFAFIYSKDDQTWRAYNVF